MRIKVNGELVYSAMFNDWTALEEAYIHHLTLRGKPVHKYAIESWGVVIALFLVEQVIDFVKDKVRAHKEERKYKEFLERLEQQMGRIAASKSDTNPEQLNGRALIELVNLGEVTIELETKVERDLLRTLNSVAAACP